MFACGFVLLTAWLVSLLAFVLSWFGVLLVSFVVMLGLTWLVCCLVVIIGLFGSIVLVWGFLLWALFVWFWMFCLCVVYYYNYG